MLMVLSGYKRLHQLLEFVMVIFGMILQQLSSHLMHQLAKQYLIILLVVLHKLGLSLLTELWHIFGSGVVEDVEASKIMELV